MVSIGYSPFSPPEELYFEICSSGEKPIYFVDHMHIFIEINFSVCCARNFFFFFHFSQSLSSLHLLVYPEMEDETFFSCVHAQYADLAYSAGIV